MFAKYCACGEDLTYIHPEERRVWDGKEVCDLCFGENLYDRYYAPKPINVIPTKLPENTYCPGLEIVVVSKQQEEIMNLNDGNVSN